MHLCFQLLWEGHKNLRNCFDIYQLNFKTIRTIAHIFVTFSEKLKTNVLNLHTAIAML